MSRNTTQVMKRGILLCGVVLLIAAGIIGGCSKGDLTQTPGQSPVATDAGNSSQNVVSGEMMQLARLVDTDQDATWFILPMTSRALTPEAIRSIGQRYFTLEELALGIGSLPHESTIISLLAEDVIDPSGEMVPLSNEEFRELAALLRANQGDSSVTPEALMELDVTRDVLVRTGFVHSARAADDWGSGRTSQGNCYRYAANDKKKAGEPHSAFPGGPDPGGRVTCEQLIAGAKKDGMHTACAVCTCGDGCYRVALFIQDTPEGEWNDYHWYRENGDGTWSHKRGSSAVSNTDASGDPITDPEAANRHYPPDADYDKFCGYLCVPGGTVDVDTHTNETPVEFEHQGRAACGGCG